MRTSVVIGLLGVVVAVLAVTVGRNLSSRHRGPEFHGVPVEVHELGRSIIESGWLVSLDSTPVAIGATGELMEITTSGQPVKDGDIVIRIDDANARERLEEVDFGLQGMELDLAASRSNYGYTELAETNRIRTMDNDCTYATLQYEEARRGLKPEDRRLLDIELEIAELDLQDADEEADRQRRLMAKGFVSQLVVDRYERHAVTARAAVEEVKARIRLEEKGVPAERLLELKKEQERLKGLVDRGERGRERALEAVLGWRRVTEAYLERSRYSRERVQEEIGGAAVAAPASGIMSIRLHYGGPGQSFMEYRPGEMRYKSEILADIVNPGRMKVELMVHEADAGQIRVGLPARVRLPAFPGRVFEGQVTEIGQVGRDRVDVAPSGYEAGQSGVTMFNATVSLEAGETTFHPGMSAIVEITTEAPTPHLVVPRAALVISDAGPKVWLKGDDGYALTTIKGRPLDSDFFVVEEGLQEAAVVGVPTRQEETR